MNRFRNNIEMESKTCLDFSLLPKLETMRMLIDLPDELLERKSLFPNFYSRIQAARYFLTQVLLKSHNFNIRDAYFRAALGEFGSSEEILRSEYGISTRMALSKNPIIHIAKEIRNLSFHLCQKESTELSCSARWGNIEFNEWPVYVIAEVAERDFLKLRNAKRYCPQDLHQMFEWFNVFQYKWGATGIVNQATIAYVNEMLAAVR